MPERSRHVSARCKRPSLDKGKIPGGDNWEDKLLDWAMNRIAELVKKTRDDNFNEFQDVADVTGKTSRKRVMNTYAIASLGGSTIDNE